MTCSNKWLKAVGLVLNLAVAGLMIFAGSSKVFGFAPPEVVKTLNDFGLGDKVLLIGIGEMTAALLMLIPWTAPLGTLAVSGFWGGVICIHMSHQQPYGFPSAFLAVTWLGSYLRGSVPLFAGCCGIQCCPTNRVEPAAPSKSA